MKSESPYRAIRSDGIEVPYPSSEALHAAIRAGQIGPTDLVRLSDQGPWTTAGSIASPSESKGDGGPSASEWVCGECGADITDDDTLCPACGTDVTKEAVPKFSEGMRRDIGPQWEAERELANPTLGFVLLTVGGSTLLFLTLAWISEVLMIIASVFLAVTLVKGPPSQISAEASKQRMAPFLYAVWAARAVLILALIWVAALTFEGGTIGWGVAAMSVLVFVPALWLPLHQLRQFSLLAIVGVLRTDFLWIVGFVTLSQAALIFAAFRAWFTLGASVGIPLAITTAAFAWLFVGNLLLSLFSARGFTAKSQA